MCVQTSDVVSQGTDTDNWKHDFPVDSHRSEIPIKCFSLISEGGFCAAEK